MNKIHSKKYILGSIILLIAVALLGAEIGLQIYELEESRTILIGITGLSNLTFIYLLFMSPGSSQKREENGLTIEFPGDIKYLVLFFLLSMIIYWSLRYVHSAILYVISIL